jgi:predicted ArsR family transcriptional regulator
MTQSINLSRRASLTALLGVTAAAAAPALVAKAMPAPVAEVITPSASPTPPAPDPIFAAIKKHRQALRKYNIARARNEAERERNPNHLPRMGVQLGERPKHKWELLRSDDNEYHARRDGRDGANHRPKELSGIDREKWIKKTSARIRRDNRQKREEWRKSPVGQASEAWNAADLVAYRSAEELLATRPTTINGVAALLKHWSKVATENRAELDLISTMDFQKDTAKSLQALAAGGVQSLTRRRRRNFDCSMRSTPSSVALAASTRPSTDASPYRTSTSLRECTASSLIISRRCMRSRGRWSRHNLATTTDLATISNSGPASRGAFSYGKCIFTPWRGDFSYWSFKEEGLDDEFCLAVADGGRRNGPRRGLQVAMG